jgi:hypothetical protein
MNAKSLADIQGARDDALIADAPIGSRAVSFDKGLPFAGEWLDEGLNAIKPGAGDRFNAVGEAMARRHPGQDTALRVGGGVAGTVAALPLAPELGLAKAGSIAGKTAATAGEAAVAAGSEGLVSGAGENGDRGANAVRRGLTQALLGGAVGGTMGNVAARLQRKAAVDAVPELGAIKAQSQGLYKAGETTGKTASPRYTKQVADEMMRIARDKAVVLPSGKINEDYGGVKHALDMVREYAGKKMDPKEMRMVREALSGAAEKGGNEGRIGSQMLRKFDEAVDPLVPEYREANKVWGRFKRGEEINKTIGIAGTRRSPTEMALSNEFAGLQRQGIRGDLTFPPELEEAVKRVAQGGGGQKGAAALGKLAPGRLIGGAGMGAAMGGSVAAGNPAGVAIGAGLGTTGLLSQALANKLAKTNAREAAAVARSGAPLQAMENMPESIRAMIAAMLAREATAGRTAPQ